MNESAENIETELVVVGGGIVGAGVARDAAMHGISRCACAHAVAWGECVCTTPPIEGKARYRCQCVGVSDDGVIAPSIFSPVSNIPRLF